jgi:hypothetical protein
VTDGVLSELKAQILAADASDDAVAKGDARLRFARLILSRDAEAAHAVASEAIRILEDSMSTGGADLICCLALGLLVEAQCAIARGFETEALSFAARSVEMCRRVILNSNSNTAAADPSTVAASKAIAHNALKLGASSDIFGGKYADAAAKLEIALEYADVLPDEEVEDSVNLFAVAMMRCGKQQDALALLRRGCGGDLLAEQPLEGASAGLVGLVATVENALRRRMCDERIKVFLRTVDAAERSGDADALGRAAIGASRAFLQIGEGVSAVQTLRRAQAGARKLMAPAHVQLDVAIELVGVELFCQVRFLSMYQLIVCRNMRASASPLRRWHRFESLRILHPSAEPTMSMSCLHTRALLLPKARFQSVLSYLRRFNRVEKTTLGLKCTQRLRSVSWRWGWLQRLEGCWGDGLKLTAHWAKVTEKVSI